MVRGAGGGPCDSASPWSRVAGSDVPLRGREETAQGGGQAAAEDWEGEAEEEEDEEEAFFQKAPPPPPPPPRSWLFSSRLWLGPQCSKLPSGCKQPPAGAAG